MSGIALKIHICPSKTAIAWNFNNYLTLFNIISPPTSKDPGERW